MAVRSCCAARSAASGRSGRRRRRPSAWPGSPLSTTASTYPRSAGREGRPDLRDNLLVGAVAGLLRGPDLDHPEPAPGGPGDVREQAVDTAAGVLDERGMDGVVQLHRRADVDA